LHGCCFRPSNSAVRAQAQRGSVPAERLLSALLGLQDKLSKAAPAFLTLACATNIQHPILAYAQVVRSHGRSIPATAQLLLTVSGAALLTSPAPVPVVVSLFVGP
jgi:hypothetical protein